MGIARYEIVPVGERWSVRHDGSVKMEYATKELAFEAASVAASMAIREGQQDSSIWRVHDLLL